jgi:hypothetical protein
MEQGILIQSVATGSIRVVYRPQPWSRTQALAHATRSCAQPSNFPEFSTLSSSNHDIARGLKRTGDKIAGVTRTPHGAQQIALPLAD